MKQFSNETKAIARELNELYLNYQDDSKADYEIQKKYGRNAWSKALSYLDYLRSEEYEVGC